VTLSARAFKAGWIASAAMAGTYSIQSLATETPIITPAGGRFAAGRTVQIVGSSGVTLRYTTDGHDPTETDAVVASGSPIAIGRSLRLKARGWKAGLEPSAVAVADFSVVGAVAAGADFTVALKSDGTLAGWGAGGLVGDGTSEDRLVPVPVVGLDGAIAVSAGKWHTLVLRADSTVWAWGSGIAIGTGDSTSHTAPTQVVDANGALSGVVAVSGGDNHSLALKQDGSVWAWGHGAFGQMGDGSHLSQDHAVQVPGLSGISAIAAGGEHNLALQTDGGTTGVVWAWGRNYNGQLGDGSTTDRLRPIVIATDVRQIVAGPEQTILVRSDGTITGAGVNEHGESGDATLVSPRLTFRPALVGVPSATKISAGGTHTLMLTAGEDVWATGQNHVGQLGDGSRVGRLSPAPVANLRRALDIVAAHKTFHSVALTDDGRVWTWGSNTRGQLGTGNDDGYGSYVPRPVPGFSAADQDWPLGDPDGDGLVTGEEIAAGSDPYSADTNGDGISDLVAVRSGQSVTNPDMDGDGVLNVAERGQGTDPLRADSDADGVADGADCFPLDPTRSTCPVAQPGDVTPPLITLSEPTSATLVNSVP
jgi:alpha-tubulin suppressor-like RCC1 family protein